MTLIEVLVAVLIFSFGLLGIVGLQGRAHSFASSAEDTNRASLLASQIIAGAQLAATTPTATGTATNLFTLPSAPDWSASAARVLPNGQVTFALDGTGKQLTVNVFWRAPTAPANSASNSFQTLAVLP